MCCGVVPILFSWFLRVPSLHALVFVHKTVLSIVPAAFFLFCFFLEIAREKRGRQGEDTWSVVYESMELCCTQRTKNHHKFKCFQVKL